MKMSDKGVELLQRFEGCRLVAYPDPATGGDPWTIGYGHTGPEVKPGLRITQYQADTWLRQDLDKFEAGVLRMTVGLVLTQNQFDALVSFAFNVGLTALERSTLMRKLKGGDVQGAADQFLKWTYAAGKQLPGLVKRRAAERDHFLGGV